MDELIVKVPGGNISIDPEVFIKLLDLSFIQGYASYKRAIALKQISLLELKSLAMRASVPYPLFFAPREVADMQVKDKDAELLSKLPSKEEIQISSRGSWNTKDVELIARDLGRKQEFLKNKILTNAPDNSFVGFAGKAYATGASNIELANQIRSFLNISLIWLRKLSKVEVLNYVCKKAEENGVFVSFSSYNYMPQNLAKDIGLSGICIKDKKFPFIFINTRDGDENPLILETEGRQIFTLLSMLVYISLNKFVFSLKENSSKDLLARRVYSIVGEVLIPEEDLKEINIQSIEELKQSSNYFKVTPSMLLERLNELNLINKNLSKDLRKIIFSDQQKRQSGPKRSVSEIKGYTKYNGNRFSQEIVNAYRVGKIMRTDLDSALFRKGKSSAELFREYTARF